MRRSNCQHGWAGHEFTPEISFSFFCKKIENQHFWPIYAELYSNGLSQQMPMNDNETFFGISRWTLD
jgi:hypothetical protein